jgi:hypothetical protein
MSNRVGDRYKCADPNCGCEIEVKAACAAGQDDANVRRDYSGDAPVVAGAEKTGTASLGHSIGDANAPEDRGFRTEGIATSSVSGPQGATGEGVFGTVSSGESDHVHTEGRYDSKLPRKTRTSGDASQLGGSSLSGSPTCFCGSKMREVGEGSGVGKTFAAGV